MAEDMKYYLLARCSIYPKGLKVYLLRQGKFTFPKLSLF